MVIPRVESLQSQRRRARHMRMGGKPTLCAAAYRRVKALGASSPGKLEV